MGLVEQHIFELIQPYIDIDTTLPLDKIDPIVFAEGAIALYAESEHIL